MDILTLSHVSKSFGTNKVIDDLSFSVPEHSVFGFIGQNGAGKTTAMKMILGLLEPDNGEIFVCGEQVHFGQNHTNKYIGYLSDVPEFYDYMTPKEYLALCGRITGMPNEIISEQSGHLLNLVGLEHSDRRIRGFSRGMKQRLGIAQALLNRPKLLICDEPTSALDPIGRKEILDILSSVKENTTVFFSTHILSDVERICDNITFLHNKTAVLCSSMEEIKNYPTGNGLEIEFCKPEDVGLFLSQYSDGIRDNELILRFDRKNQQDMITIMQVLVRHNIAIRRLERLEPALEDLFMEVVRK
ncbi:MAG: ABC transporter ATP-binding protein [Lachnospiraceae bacterium]|nr:ABC transporter ATP-binding protein [Lachnospiraceae bacterium]